MTSARRSFASVANSLAVSASNICTPGAVSDRGACPRRSDPCHAASRARCPATPRGNSAAHSRASNRRCLPRAGGPGSPRHTETACSCCATSGMENASSVAILRNLPAMRVPPHRVLRWGVSIATGRGSKGSRGEDRPPRGHPAGLSRRTSGRRTAQSRPSGRRSTAA